MSKYTAYLVGQISMNNETYEWRKRVRDYFNELKFRGQLESNDIYIIDPTASEFNKGYAQTGCDENHCDKEQKPYAGIDLLPAKDYRYVIDANIIIANLNHYTPERPIIGSYFELAWAYANPGKMIIGIYDGDPEQDFHCRHPFVWKTIQTWVKTENEACDLIYAYMD